MIATIYKVLFESLQVLNNIIQHTSRTLQVKSNWLQSIVTATLIIFISQNNGAGYVFKVPLQTPVYNLKPEILITALFRSSSFSNTFSLHMKMEMQKLILRQGDEKRCKYSNTLLSGSKNCFTEKNFWFCPIQNH